MIGVVDVGSCDAIPSAGCVSLDKSLPESQAARDPCSLQPTAGCRLTTVPKRRLTVRGTHYAASVFGGLLAFVSEIVVCVAHCTVHSTQYDTRS